MIELRDLHKSFGTQEVLAGVTFQVPERSSMVLMGPSGSGKSVMLKHVIGLLRPDKGDVLVDGLSVPGRTRDELREMRREMGYLFQHGALINWLSVFDNVALPLRETTSMRADEVRERVEHVLELVHMQEAAAKLPSEISGGMQKRVGLARALVTDARTILYDEPEAGLDPEMANNINLMIRGLQQELGMTSIVVTHSIACALTVGDRLAIFDRGKIILEAPPKEVLQSDVPRVRQFLGAGMD